MKFRILFYNNQKYMDLYQTTIGTETYDGLLTGLKSCIYPSNIRRKILRLHKQRAFDSPESVIEIDAKTTTTVHHPIQRLYPKILNYKYVRYRNKNYPKFIYRDIILINETVVRKLIHLAGMRNTPEYLNYLEQVILPEFIHQTKNMNDYWESIIMDEENKPITTSNIEVDYTQNLLKIPNHIRKIWEERIRNFHDGFYEHLRDNKRHNVASFMKTIRFPPEITDLYTSDLQLLETFPIFMDKYNDRLEDPLIVAYKYEFTKHVTDSKKELVTIIVPFLKQLLGFYVIKNTSRYIDLRRHRIVDLLKELIIRPYVENFEHNPAEFIIGLQETRQILFNDRKTCGGERFGRFISYTSAFFSAHHILEEIPKLNIYLSCFKRKHQMAMISVGVERQDLSREKQTMLESIDYPEVYRIFLNKAKEASVLKVNELGELLQIAFTFELGAKRPGEFRYGFYIHLPYEYREIQKLMDKKMLSQLRSKLSTPFTKNDTFCIFLISSENYIQMMWNISKNNKAEEQSIEYLTIYHPDEICPKYSSSLLQLYLTKVDQIIFRPNGEPHIIHTKTKLYNERNGAYRKLILNNTVYEARALFPSNVGTIRTSSVSIFRNSILVLNNQKLRPLLINHQKEIMTQLTQNPMIRELIQERLPYQFNDCTKVLMESFARIVRHSSYIQRKHYSDRMEIVDSDNMCTMIGYFLLDYYSLPESTSLSDAFISFIETNFE
jgi:hypothetical protein